MTLRSKSVLLVLVVSAMASFGREVVAGNKCPKVEKEPCPTTVEQLPASTCATANQQMFRLCVVCPANAVVIIDGRHTKSSDTVREYCLQLPTGTPRRNIDLLVLQAGHKKLIDQKVTVVGGSSLTVVAAKSDSSTKRDELLDARDKLQSERDQLQQIRDTLQIERDKLQQERDRK